MLAQNHAVPELATDLPDALRLDPTRLAEAIPEEVDDANPFDRLERELRLEEPGRLRVVPERLPQEDLPPALVGRPAVEPLEERCGHEPFGAGDVAVGCHRNAGMPRRPRIALDRFDQRPSGATPGDPRRDVQARKDHQLVSEWSPRRADDR